MNRNLILKIVPGAGILLVIVLLLWVFVFNSWNSGSEFSEAGILQASLIGDDSSAAGLLETGSVPTPVLRPVRDWSVEDLEINARSAIAVEISPAEKDKVLFRKNEGERYPIASITKLMSALVVLKNYELEWITIISQEAINQSGEQGMLTFGEYLSVENLLYIMLIESSNDAAYALAEIVTVPKFIDLMNAEAFKIGMTQTRFADATGVSSENYSSVGDLVRFAKYLFNDYPLVWEILSYQEYELYAGYSIQKRLHHILRNTNELLGRVPDIVSGKTGFTFAAKECLLLITKNQAEGDNLIYVVLGSDDRFGEMERLIDWVNAAYKW